MHFSIDDCIGIFKDLTENEDKYESMFQQPYLGFLKELNEKYGTVVSLYCYYEEEDGSFPIADATDKFAMEFTENSEWLRCGFHAKDASAYESVNAETECEYYQKTLSELLRVTGAQECIDNFVRLDRYYADQDMITVLSTIENGIVGLFAADDAKRQSYDLTEEQMDELYEKDWYVGENGIAYTPTDIRLESIRSDKEFYSLLESLSEQTTRVVFTHEWLMDEENVRKYITWLSKFANLSHVKFDFPENRISDNEKE